MLKRLYDWLIRLAGGPNAMLALAAVSFVESSFFPLPPDILLIPMVLARPRACLADRGGVHGRLGAGGFLGYAIGYFLFDAIGRPVLEFYRAMGATTRSRQAFDEWGAWIIILKGMTPIPYKLVTIASGVAHFDLVDLRRRLADLAQLRFFLLAALLWGSATRSATSSSAG